MLEFRPRPPLWRLALLSAAQILVAAWIVSVAVAALEIVAMKRWLFYATPWDTPWHRLGVRAIDIDPKFIGPAAAAACVIAAIALWLWPTRQTLGSRHFAHIIAAVLAVYGAIRLGMRAPLMYAAPTLVASIVIVFIAERRALSLLRNALDTHRLALWFLRIVPASALLALTSWLAHYRAGVYLAAIFTASMLLVAFLEPPARFERVDDVELRSGVIALALAAFVLLTASAAVFGVINARAIVATPKGWAIKPLPAPPSRDGASVSRAPRLSDRA